MTWNKAAHIAAFASLGLLLVVELVTRYDAWGRQIALSLTNIVGTLVYLLILRLLKRHGIHLPGVISLLVAAGIWSDAMGNFWHLFGDWLWWDKVAHFIGSIAPASVLWTTFDQLIKKRVITLPRWSVDLYTVSLTLLVVVLYEISEMLGDLWFDTHRVTDLFDTADDLMYNLAGALVVVIVARLVGRLRRQRFS